MRILFEEQLDRIDKVELAGEAKRAPRHSSGAMYCGVPSASPVLVMRSPPACSSASAIPKSATSACPSRSSICT